MDNYPSGDDVDGAGDADVRGRPGTSRAPDYVGQRNRQRVNATREGVDGSPHNGRQVRKPHKSKSREPSVIISYNDRVRRQYSNNDKDLMVGNEGHERSRSRERTLYRASRKRSRSPDRLRRSSRRTRVLRSRSRHCSNSSDEYENPGRKSRRRRRDESGDDDDSPIRRLIKRRRSRAPSRQSHHNSLNRDSSGGTQDILNKFLDILTSVKGKTTSKLSLSNVLPEFDPLSKDQTIVTWLTKVEECADIYDWDEREIIHFALPKLTGVARQWYQSQSTVLYTWTEWKRKLIESFPYRQDYAELLSDMLAKRVRYSESLEQYYYTKMNLLNQCGIVGRKAVDCLLHGVDDRAIRVGAQAARFREPEEVLKYFKTVKPGTSKEVGDKSGREKKLNQSNDKSRLGQNNKTITNIKCFNCNEVGHKSFKCVKPANKCDFCNKKGHLSQHCRTKVANNNQNNERRDDTDNNNVKNEKQVALLDQDENSNDKYNFEIKINDKPIMCLVDLGSQCTLIRESEAKRLNLNLISERLPLLRGIGGNPVQPLGKCDVDVTVQGINDNIEVLVVDDNVIKQPVLLGHTFTEKPNIIITKTPDQIIFEKFCDTKLFLVVQNDVTALPNQLISIPVSTHSKYSGPIYVNGTVRNVANSEHYLLPGEYKLVNGSGRVLVQNICNNSVLFKEGSLLTRSIPITNTQDVLSVSFDNSSPDDAVQCGSEITVEQKLELQKLLSKFKDCFSSGLNDIGFTTAGEMVIELNDNEPVVYRPYRMSHGERSMVRDMVQEMLDAGIVQESSSPYASPIVLVKKKTGDRRLCVDYRALNKRTKKDHYPLPLIDDQLDRLAGNKLFISLDLASGYYQIPIEKGSQDKTAFITPDGLYQFTRMPFGLVNAPSVFQRTINKILSDAKIKYALVYMDDILIPARSFEEGLSRLEEVLCLLKKGGLTLKLSKCNFFMNNIDFLGFEINHEGIKPGEKKTEAVSKFPAPKGQRELQQFIGLANFFRRFVQGFANIARPLTNLLKKNAEWQWGPEQNKAFETIKSVLVQRPLLALYDPKRETQVHTDASKHGVGAILLQKDDAGLFRPVSYYSRKTTPDEQKLHSFELETLAVIAALNRFRVYLLGIPFKILTDCNALRTTLSKRDLWIQFQEFDCDIEYRPGSSMYHADALSRNPVGNAREEQHVLDVLTVGTEDWISTVQESDDEIIRIKEILTDPNSEKVVDILKNYKIKNNKVYRIIGSGDNDIRWVVPRGVRWQIAKFNHDDLGHFGFEKTLARVRQSYWFPKMRKFIKKYVKSCLECARSKDFSGKQQGELHPIPKPEIPFHTIHADHLGPFVRSKKGNCYLLVIVDGFTKYVNIKPVRNTKSSTTIKALKEHIACFGAPSRLITDRGTSFTSHSFSAFIRGIGVKHVLNAVATPRANGQCERYNRTILSALAAKANNRDDKNWDDYIADIQIGINTTIHKTTGKSASELLFGFNINSNSENMLSEILDDTRELATENLNQVRIDTGKRIVEQQTKTKVRYDSKRLTSQNYEIGDLVSVKRDVPSDGNSKKLAAKFQGPYKIKKVLPNDRYLIESTPLTLKRGQRKYENIVAIDKLKPWLVFNRGCETTESESDNTDADQDTK